MMRMTTLVLIALALAGQGVPTMAQSRLSDLTGTWQTETPEGPQRLIVGPDSTVRLGEDSVQWRQSADSVFLLLGGEWVGYHYVLRESTLTLSGGDLVDPLVLRRVAPLPAVTHLTTPIQRSARSDRRV